MTNNIIFVGDIPQYDHYIDGNSIKPMDTRFKVDDRHILYFNKIPKNIDKYLEYSEFPIHIFVKTPDKIPHELKDKFEIVDNSGLISTKQIISNIFYNPDRKQVYDILVKNNPPLPRIHMYLKQNIVRILKSVPVPILQADEKVLNILPKEYYYNLVAHGIQPTNEVKKIKWLKKTEN